LLWDAAVSLLSRQFDQKLHGREAMGVLCTCCRAGWTLLTATLMLGGGWVERQLPSLQALWKRAVHVVGNQPSSFEPTHELVCLDAALGSLLG
jgi:hypothetical protein